MSACSYDRQYLISNAGVTKVAVLVSMLCGVLCIVCESKVPLGNFRAAFYYANAILCCTLTALVLAARLFSLCQRYFYTYNVNHFELVAHAVQCLSCFVTGAVTLSLAVSTYATAAFFALLAASCNACDGYISFRRSRQRNAATQTDNKQLNTVEHN